MPWQVDSEGSMGYLDFIPKSSFQSLFAEGGCGFRSEIERHPPMHSCKLYHQLGKSENVNKTYKPKYISAS